MSKEVTVSKVEIDVAGKLISLTLEEAQELQDVLNKTFPKPTEVIREKEYIPIPSPYPYRRLREWWATDKNPRWSVSVKGQTLQLSNK